MDQTKQPKLESFELTEFNLEDQITIAQHGVIKIFRNEDKDLIMVRDYDYGLIDRENPTPMNIGDTDAILGFTLDIGIQRRKHLTYGDGFYHGTKIVQTQSLKKISQDNFDPALFEKTGHNINRCFQSGDPQKEIAAVKMNHLLAAYNNARLLFPTFYNESFLGLMRILDAIFLKDRAVNFATSAALFSPDLNREIYKKLSGVGAFQPRLKIAEGVFNECLAKAEGDRLARMKTLDLAGKVIFACFYSAYQYRSMFVHQGLPFPDIVKQAIGIEEDAGTAYLHPATGESLIKIFRPAGLQDGDTFDVHDIVTDPDEAKNFKEKYFLLIPTWYFLKKLVREALIAEIYKLS